MSYRRTRRSLGAMPPRSNPRAPNGLPAWLRWVSPGTPSYSNYAHVPGTYDTLTGIHALHGPGPGLSGICGGLCAVAPILAVL